MDINKQALNKTPFKYNYHEVIEYDQNLGSVEKELIQIINKKETKYNKYYNLIAGMGSGKTYTMLDIAMKTPGMKMILLVPLQVIALQKYNEIIRTYTDSEIALVMGAASKTQLNGTGPKEIKEFLKNDIRVFICVYNSLKKFFDDSLSKIFNAKDYILVVDEAHYLSTEYDYRDVSINYIQDVIERFKKVIFLTGTPECALEESYKTFLFVPKSEPEPQNVTILQYSGDVVYNLFLLLQNFKDSELNIVLIDNKKDLQDLYNALVNTLENPEQVKILHSALKESDDYIYLTRKENIDPSVKFLLTTRLISDGVNLYSERCNIFVTDCNNNFWVKRQLIMRFRRAEKKVFDLNRKCKSSSETLRSFEEFYHSTIESTTDLIELSKRQFKDKRKIYPKLTLEKHFENNNGAAYYSEYKDAIVLSKNHIRFLLINKINSLLPRKLSLTRLLYKELANFSVTVEDIDKHIDSQTAISEEEFDLLSGRIKELPLKKQPEIIFKYFRQIFTEYLLNIDRERTFNQNLYRLIDHGYYQNTFLKGMISVCVNNKESIRLIDDIYNLAVDGYPESLLKKMLYMKITDPKRFAVLKLSLNLLTNYRIINSCEKYINLIEDSDLYSELVNLKLFLDTIEEGYTFPGNFRNELFKILNDYDPIHWSSNRIISTYFNALFILEIDGYDNYELLVDNKYKYVIEKFKFTLDGKEHSISCNEDEYSIIEEIHLVKMIGLLDILADRCNSKSKKNKITTALSELKEILADRSADETLISIRKDI